MRKGKFFCRFDSEFQWNSTLHGARDFWNWVYKYTCTSKYTKNLIYTAPACIFLRQTWLSTRSFYESLSCSSFDTSSGWYFKILARFVAFHHICWGPPDPWMLDFYRVILHLSEFHTSIRNLPELHLSELHLSEIYQNFIGVLCAYQVFLHLIPDYLTSIRTYWSTMCLPDFLTSNTGLPYIYQNFIGVFYVYQISYI